MQYAAMQQQNLLALKKKQYDVKFDLDGTKYLPIENIGTGKFDSNLSSTQVILRSKHELGDLVPIVHLLIECSFVFDGNFVSGPGSSL